MLKAAWRDYNKKLMIESKNAAEENAYGNNERDFHFLFLN